MQHQVVRLDEQTLDNLALNPDNIVYRYRDTPAQEQDLDQVLRDVRDLWDEWRQHQPFQDSKEADRLRAQFLRNERWRLLKERAHYTFSAVTRHDSSIKDLKLVEQTIKLIRRTQRGEIENDDGKNQLGEYLVQNFGVPASNTGTDTGGGH